MTSIAGTRSGTLRSAFPDTYLDGKGRGGRGGSASPLSCRREAQLGQGGRVDEQVEALQAGERGKPGPTPRRTRPVSQADGLQSSKDEGRNKTGRVCIFAWSFDVKTDGDGLAVTFPGMKLGIFDGKVVHLLSRDEFIQMDAIARRTSPG